MSGRRIRLARRIAETAIRSEAGRKNNPPDLINVAVEKLVEASLELPAFSTLNKMTARIRTEVNQQLFQTIDGRLTGDQRAGLERLPTVVGPGRMSLFNELTRPARSPTWSHLREQVAHLQWVDSLGDTDAWMEGIAASKVTDFAGEAQAADAAVLGDYGPAKIDDDSAVAAMNTTAADLAAESIARLGAHEDHDGEVPFVFEKLSKASGPQVAALLQALTLQMSGMDRIQATVAGFGGFAEVYSDIEEVSAHYGDNYEVLVARFLLKTDRAALFDLTGLLELAATSDDRRVLDALAHAQRHRDKTRDYITDRDPAGAPIDVGFASEKWRKAIRDEAHPGRLARRHFEACVFVHLAAELRTGDIAVAGAGEYADWNAQLLSWVDCADKLPGYLVEVGLVEDLDAARRYDAKAFRDQLFDKLTTTAARADEGYPTNEDLQIDPKTGVPRLVLLALGHLEGVRQPERARSWSGGVRDHGCLPARHGVQGDAQVSAPDL